MGTFCSFRVGTIETYDQLTAEELLAFALTAQRLQVAVERAMSADGTFHGHQQSCEARAVPHLPHAHRPPQISKVAYAGFFWPRPENTPQR